MTHDRTQHDTTQRATALVSATEMVSRLRAYLSSMPEVRLAYYQPAPMTEPLCLSGPDHARVIIAFTRSVSGEHAEKRLAKIRRHFAPILAAEVEFLDIEQIEYREACEIAFNAQLVYGGPEAAERDRLYRYNVFLEWNAGKKHSGLKQDPPPAVVTSVERPVGVLSIPRFVTPIYRHLKLIEGHLRELRPLIAMDLPEFEADHAQKSLAESYILKAIQSAILITMSIMHRNVRLAARDYRDLFLLMPVYGIAGRERAARLAKCADTRDRLVFQYEEVTAVEVYQHAFEVVECLQDFKSFMLDWLFERYYGPSGELIQGE